MAPCSCRISEVYLVSERTVYTYTTIKGVPVRGGQFSLDITSLLYQHFKANMNKLTIIGLVLAVFAAGFVSDVGGFPLDKKESFLNI